MKNFPLLCKWFVLLVACGFATSFPAFAQSAETPAADWHEVHIKNVAPHLLAYWIDPIHNEMPQEYKSGKEFAGSYFMKKPISSWPKESIKGLSILPERNQLGQLTPDMSKVLLVPDDAGHVIYVRAAPEDYKQIEPIITFWDRPIRKITLSVKVMQLHATEPLTEKKASPFQLLFAPSEHIGFGDYSEKTQLLLNDLIAQNKLEVLNDRQLTIRNNLTESISQTSFVPATIDIKTPNNSGDDFTINTSDGNQLFLEKQFSMVFTPTINNDDTITIFTTLASNAMLTHQKSATSDDHLWIQSLTGEPPRSTVCTVHSGGTVIMGGLNSTKLGLDNKSLPVIVLMKAEIVR